MPKIKSLLIAGTCALLLLPIALYVGSLDWRFQHSQYVGNLPFYSKGKPAGEYRIRANGMEFRATLYGMENSGNGLVLLHGFPEMSVMWEPLAQAAAKAGYRVVAFDQRGYSPGARPGGIENYQLDLLASDVTAIADQLGFSRFHLMGHDWGSIVGWRVTQLYSERILSWAAMAIPHVGLFLQSVTENPEQQERSAYIKLLRYPVLPEFFSLYAGQRNLKGFLNRLPEAHQTQYLKLLREPGAMTAALNWYRALDNNAINHNPSLMQPTKAPTLFIWGTQDTVVAPSVINQLPEFVSNYYHEVELNTGHSIIQTDADAVVSQSLTHFARFSVP